MRNQLTLLAAVSIVVITTACASSGGGAPSARSSCALLPGDSVFAAHAPVFRDCAVTTKARVLSTSVHAEFTPTGAASCDSAEYEFVVTPGGLVDVETARLVKSNDQQFADAVRLVRARLKYEPATRDGAPVAQIADFKQAMQRMTVVVPAGTSPSSVRPRGMSSRPTC